MTVIFFLHYGASKFVVAVCWLPPISQSNIANMPRTLWLSEAVLTWDADFDSGTRSDIKRVIRPHELFTQSERQLNLSQNEFTRASVILNLKRAISIRLQHLEDLYAFSKAFPNDFGALERLNVVGLARPLLIRQLFALRNDIEHNDATPPSENKCRELIDSTWYFLKTTDYACKLVPAGVSLQNPANPIDGHHQWITARFTASSSEVDIHGWLSSEFLSVDERPGFFAVREETLDTSELAAALRQLYELKPDITDAATSSLLSFQGRAPAPQAIKHQLWKVMLETL